VKAFRAHRFPPLAQAPRAAGAVQWQGALDDGFRQGMEEGYRQGHASGLANGHAEGHAAALDAGRAEGLAQGRAAARQETMASFENVAKPVDAILERLRSLHTDYQSAMRKEMVELVARVARQVVRCELTLQPVQLLALVDETLATLPPSPSGDVEVYLNPEDLKRILEIDPKRFKRWTLLADPRLESGECNVRVGDQEVDAGCSQRLAACIEQVQAQLVDVDEEALEPVEATS
jgi:flagellar assembly protein FliH